MKVTKFEGTAEEFRCVADLFGYDSLRTGVDEAGDILATNVERNIEPKEAIRKMLKRLRIPEGQRSVYKTLKDGEVKAEDMPSKLGRTYKQYRGVMGALGRRINNTKEIHDAGLPGSITAVIIYRETDDGTYLSLTQDAKEVLIEEGVI